MIAPPPPTPSGFEEDTMMSVLLTPTATTSVLTSQMSTPATPTGSGAVCTPLTPRQTGSLAMPGQHDDVVTRYNKLLIRLSTEKHQILSMC